MMTQRNQIIVIGAGIGGLTTAALLAHDGYDVTVLEGQTYPGGSASTFYHKGYRFDSGATVAGGFQPNGPHSIVGKMLNIQWDIHQHDPAWVVHLPDKQIALTQDYTDIVAKFPDTEAFWSEQQQIADIAWQVAAQGLPWTPADLGELWQLIKVGIHNFPQDLRVIPFALSTVKQWMRRKGVADDKAFTRFVDATLLISAQSTSDYVNGVYGATAMDLARQGVYHITGGIGGIAATLVSKIQELGGQVLYRQNVTCIMVENRHAMGVYAMTGKRTTKEQFFAADFVIANTTPWSLDSLLGEQSPARLQREVQQRTDTQGAFVLHLAVDAAKLPPNFSDHHQIVKSLDGAMGEGETLFLSMSPQRDTSRAPQGQRAVTVSTHTNVQQWWDLLHTSEAAYYERKEEYTSRMLEAIDYVIPQFKSAVTLALTGTPVTYQYYTSRYKGMVGGFPQTSLFKARNPRTGIPNLRLVGDSIFPGQSTAGVTLGGIRVANDVKRHLPLRSTSRLFSPIINDSCP